MYRKCVNKVIKLCGGNNTVSGPAADLRSDCSTSLTASCSASLIFCSIILFSSLVFMAVTSSRCLSCSESAALWASSLASSSAIWAFSASRSAVSSDRSWGGNALLG